MHHIILFQDCIVVPFNYLRGIYSSAATAYDDVLTTSEVSIQVQLLLMTMSSVSAFITTCAIQLDYYAYDNASCTAELYCNVL
jgi:hypothetical protein